MEAYEPFVSLAVALLVGLLIGMQREQSTPAAERQDALFIGGVRTFPLYALSGALATILGQKISFWFIPMAFVAVMTPAVVAYADDVRNGRDRGITTEVAAVITFLLGCLTVSVNVIEPHAKKLQVVASVAVTVTGLLSLKKPLHDMASRISHEDIFATLKFLIIAVIVLPLLPNENYGPLDVLNPFNIGLMIVLMAGIGFVGYVAIRALGAGRGMGLTGLVGGLVSSTAVTLAAAGRARENAALANACAMAAVLASSIMPVRVAIEVGAVNRDLLPTLLPPLAAMFASGLLCAYYLYRRGNSEKVPSEVQFHNPFELGLAIKFGLLFALVLLATKAATVYLGQHGIYVAAVLAGTTDMDAITLSMANLAAAGQVDRTTAAISILLGGASNSIVKSVLAISLGGWLFGRKVLLSFLIVLAVTAAAATLSL
jgi:uncharacterized membrane protein (DUF4010 family)